MICKKISDKSKFIQIISKFSIFKKSINKKIQDPFLLEKQAQEYISKKKYEKGIRALKLAISKFVLLGKKEKVLELYELILNICIKRGDNPSTIKYYLELAYYCEEYLKNDKRAAEYFKKAGDLEFKLERYDLAVKYYYLNYKLLKRINDLKSCADISMEMSKVNLLLDKYMALKNMNLAFRIYHENNDYQGMKKSFNLLIKISYEIKYYDMLIVSSIILNKYVEKNGKKYYVCYLNKFIGDLYYFYKKDIKSALRYYYKSAKDFEKNSSNYYMAAYMNNKCGDLARELGDDDKALTDYFIASKNYEKIDKIKESLEIVMFNAQYCKRIGNYSRAANCYYKIGKLFHELGRINKSIYFFRKAARYFIKIKNYSHAISNLKNVKYLMELFNHQDGIAEVSEEIAELYLLNEDYKTAQKFYYVANIYNLRFGNISKLAEITEKKGNLYLNDNEIKTARKNYYWAAHYYEEDEDYQGALRMYNKCYELCTVEGKLDFLDSLLKKIMYLNSKEN